MNVVMMGNYCGIVSKYCVVKDAPYSTASDVFEYVLGSKKKYFEDLGIDKVVLNDGRKVLKEVMVR